MSRVCESCGGPGAKLFAYWPAVLCPVCVQERIDANKVAEATSTAPPSEASVDRETDVQPTGKPRSEMTHEEIVREGVRRRNRARKQRIQERKRNRAESVDCFRSIMGPMVGLIRVLLRDGNVPTAASLTRSLVESYVSTLHASTTGLTFGGLPVDAMLAKLRAANVIGTEEFLALMEAHQIMSLTRPEDDHTPTGKALTILESILDGEWSLGKKSRHSRGRRFRREGYRITEIFDPEPSHTFRERLPDGEPELIPPGKIHRIQVVREAAEETLGCSVSKSFDDTPEGLRALASTLAQWSGVLGDGERLVVENSEPMEDSNHVA